MEWTKQQEAVIKVRNKNVLVSAAAGSGKTAVLVERIIKLITDVNNPVDVDKLLVVTFTKAAAGEMRERILKALEKALNEATDDAMREHLQKQCTYIHSAKITTIDSFCQHILRENIANVDIDPAYRMAEKSELVLMEADAIEEVLNAKYESGDAHFMEFVDTYSAKVGDGEIEKLIFKLHKYASSYPNPNAWIKNSGLNYDFEDIDSWKKGDVARYISDDIDSDVNEAIKNAKNAIELCTEENGLMPYKEAFLNDIEQFETIINTSDLEVKFEMVKNYSPVRFKSVKNVDDNEKKFVSGKRKTIKNLLDGLKDGYCKMSLTAMLQNFRECKKIVNTLIDLTIEYGEKLWELKMERNILDFPDVAHLVLSILTEEKDGIYYPTQIAKEISEEYVEVMIDEYQDSNHVQEVLLNAVSKCHTGKNNIFMVGDVKQSIYKFRQAKPELFLEKYRNYPTSNDSDVIKIILSMNFRSRNEIINSVNLICSQIMTKELGGIEYDDDSKLYLGAKYKNVEQNQECELILIDKSKDRIGNTGNLQLAGEVAEDEDDVTNIQAEAIVVANKIKEMTEGDKALLVYDKELDDMRPATYKDIVVLFRTKGVVGTFYETLLAKGIPVTSSIKESMLDAFEIRVIMDMLKVIDNPRQDIPLVSVLKNVFSFNETELAMIKETKTKKCFYDCFVEYEGEMTAKRDAVLKFLQKYRHYATYMPIYRLIKIVIDETNFIDFISAMDNGEQRLFNIDIFIQRAEEYAKGSYTGLFNFIRYIDKVKSYNAEEKDDTTLSNEENTVKLMTIHKSKGLEYPIVFVATIGKKYNESDVLAKVLIHSRLGIGVDRVDTRKRIRYTTFIRRMISNKIKEEDIAEELRILYVALTRAKEKLILIGSGDVSSTIKRYQEFSYSNSPTVPRDLIFDAKCIMDLMIMALIRHNSFDGINRLLLKEPREDNVIYNYEGGFKITLLGMEDIAYDVVKEVVSQNITKEELINWDASKVYSDDIREKLNSRFLYVYKYDGDTRIRAKHSVSDIKHAKMEIGEFEENKMHLSEDVEEYIPIFMRNEDDKKEDVNGSALRGSAVHRFFELFDYDAKAFEVSDIEKMKEKIRNKGTMNDKELELVVPKIFAYFMKVGLGLRMQEAYKRKELFRERPFVMGMKAREVDESYDSDEIVVVQGIIDAFFYEDGEVVIVDYKTDNVSTIEELVGRYKAQLDCYGEAIKKVTGKNVKEKLIYSTKFNEVIVV